MTTTSNILGALSQLAPAGQSPGVSQTTNVSQTSTAVEDFNTVLAALLGTGTPETAAIPPLAGGKQTDIDPTTAPEIDLASVQQALEDLGLDGETIPLDANGEPSIEDLIANMLDLLEKLASQFNGDTPIDPDLVNEINAELATLLENKTFIGTNVPEGEPDIPAPQLQTLAQQLTEMAQKLANVQPELAQKIDALAQKLNPVAQAADATAPELLNAAAAAVRTKDQPGKTNPALQQPREGDLIAALENKTKAVTAGTAGAGVGNDGAETTNNADAAKPNLGEARAAANAEARLGLNGAQPNLTANPPVNASQPDSLLMVQTMAQPTGATDGLSAVKPMTAAYQSPVQNLNMPHIAVEFVRQMRDGASRFQIRMDPPEMGRIDVKLDMDNQGNINARLTVERADTLDLLQRDARALERALAQAGLDTGRTNLEFSLKQSPFGGQDGQPGREKFGADNPLLAGSENDPDTAISEIAQTLIYRGSSSPGGINMIA